MFRVNGLVAVVLATMLSLFGSAIYAAVPSLVNYQGILTNPSGTPQVGTFSVTFTIYNAPAGGTSQWSEVQSVTTDSEGRFTVLLGSLNGLGDSVFSDAGRYLGIAVSPDGEMVPRTEIVAVGYAVHSSTLTHTRLVNNITVVGKGAGNTASTGLFNTAIGNNALRANTSALGNTAVGHNVMFNTTIGGLNTACGHQALYANFSGARNTAYGAGALGGNSIGVDNSAIGYAALANNADGSNNTAFGEQAMIFHTTGGFNTAVGSQALSRDTTGTYNTALGHDATVATDGLTNAMALGANSTVNASNKIRFGDTLVTVIEGQVAYTFTSDKNAKENFREVNGDEVLQKLRDLDVQSWNYKGHDPEHFRHYGPVAQDFYAAFGKDEVGTVGTPTTINSGDMAGILMIAVQALEKRTAENEELKARIEALEKLVLAK